MAWFKMDDGFAFHPKTMAAGNAATGLFCRMGAWCSDQLTEGHVPAAQARIMGTASELRRLVDVGYLHRPGDDCRCLSERPEGALDVPGSWAGYWLHDFLAYNPTRAKVMAERSQAAERQRRAREAAAQRRAAEAAKEAENVTA